MPEESSQRAEQCPECGQEVTEQDPLLGLWMCHDCEIGFNDNGRVIAE